ncbi:MAG: type II secretion system protein [Patescibacteria group bacterium]
MTKGLTLIEVLIVIAVALILLAFIVVPFKRMNDTQALSKETQNVISIINQARSQTLSSKGGIVHGVHLESSQVVLFGGPTYVPSDPNNASIPLHALVSISNINLSGGAIDIVFNRLTGTTAVSGTITLSLIASSTQSKLITVTSTGIVNGSP